MQVITLSVLYIFVPAMLLYGEKRWVLAHKIGPVLMAYAMGILIGNIGWLPKPSAALSDILHANQPLTKQYLSELLHQGVVTTADLSYYTISRVQDVFTTITVPLSIPLLLFTLNIRNWYAIAGKTFISMLAAIVSVVGLILSFYYLFGESIPNIDKISGMLVGLYTGGTPNLASLRMILDVDTETYIITHTYDSLISFIYLMFLITVGKFLFRKWLGEKKISNHHPGGIVSKTSEQDTQGRPIGKWKDRIWSVCIALGIFGVAGALSLIVPSSIQMLVVILTITSLSILVSLVRFVNKLQSSFDIGMYLIVVFSMVIASMADIEKLLHVSGPLLAYITLIIFGTLFLHAILCKLFKIDADTLMITSTALICSPPFVPMIAGSLNNRDLVVPGLTVGIIGYAIGNYLGTFIYYLIS